MNTWTLTLENDPDPIVLNHEQIERLVRVGKSAAPANPDREVDFAHLEWDEADTTTVIEGVEMDTRDVAKYVGRGITVALTAMLDKPHQPAEQEPEK